MSGGYTPGLRTEPVDLGPSFDFLASEHYSVKRSGITLDSTAVTADDDGNKIVKGGTVLAKIDATGKYVPYVESVATDGSATAAGILFAGDVNLRHGDVICGLLMHGSVLRTRCTGLDDGAETDLAGRITFQ